MKPYKTITIGGLAMQLKSNSINRGVRVDIIGARLYMTQYYESVSLDREQAQQLLSILEHFIKTGELPDAS